MTKRLARFMDEVEHYDPTIVCRPGKLQVVPDALSRMAGQSEGEPADTDRFIVAEMEDTLFTADHADAAENMLTQCDSHPVSTTESDQPDPCPASTTESDEHDPPPVSRNNVSSNDHGSDDPETNRVNHNSPYYHRIQRYLQKHAELDDVDEKFKHECEKYELRDGILYNARTGRRVILDLEFMKETLEFTHKDIGHYGKRATSKAVA